VQREIGLKTYPSSEAIMAYRGLIPSEGLTWAKDIGGKMTMWLGKGRSFLCYPVSSGRLINMVAFVPTNLESEKSWMAQRDLKALAAEYADWDDPVLETIGALDQTFRWGIYARAPLPYWSTGRMTLLGDAAHPMVPHLGQGAGQVIEDGFTLAVLLEGAKRRDIPRRLKAYEGLRLERTSQIRTMARCAGRFFRAEYEDVTERDRLMAKLWPRSDGPRGTMQRRLLKKHWCLLVTTRRSEEAPTCGIAASLISAMRAWLPPGTSGWCCFANSATRARWKKP
jgi:salicylate hydroxylase